jgi:MYXO-CTERM domain-containing protein
MRFSVLLLVLALASPAWAQTYQIEGVVTSSQLPVSLQVGESVTFTFTYDASRAVADVRGGDAGAYFLSESNPGLLTDVAMTYAGVDYPLEADLIFSNLPNSSGLGDTWSPQLNGVPSFDGQLPANFNEFRLWADESEWPNDIPIADLTAANWTRGTFNFEFGDGDPLSIDNFRVNGTLDLSSLSEVVAPAITTLIDITPEAAGPNCDNGGVRISVGADDGDPSGTLGNGILESGEVERFAYACNGADGQDGAPGADGQDGVDGAPGADGQDGVDGAPGADGQDGVDGAPGADGADGEDGSAGADGEDGAPGADGEAGESGFSSLLNLVPEPPGANCANGGFMVEAGLDDGAPAGTAGDGVLDAGEVDQAEYVCAPAPSAAVGNADDEESESGCSTAPGTSGVGLLVGLLALALRRRR